MSEAYATGGKGRPLAGYLALMAGFSAMTSAGGGKVNEEVRGSGAAHAVGDLLICPICMDLWVASTLAIVLGLAPRATRIVAFVPARSETLP
jgi:hypothetical protein